MITGDDNSRRVGQFRALLIGVPFYADEAIKNLPFIETDMAALETVLRDVGYDVQVHDIHQTDRDSIDTAVELFIADALPGQTLLIYLSGHGVHYSGKDYLVPSGALTRSRNFPARCVPIAFGPYVEPSRAGDVLVFVDACREGIDLREMGAVNAASWSERQVERTGSRRFAYVYACSSGERARYVTAGAATFSLFSRALAEIIGNEDGPRTLAQIKPALQDALDSLVSDSQVPRQLIRVLTETDSDAFVVLPRKGQRDEDTSRRDDWVPQARDHVAWKQVSDGPGVEALHEATVALVEQLAASWERDVRTLKGDPWRDQKLAVRMNSKIRWLLQTVLNPEKLKLSPAEAALLVSFPFLYESFWARHAARRCHVMPADLDSDGSDESDRFRQFAASYGRLLRRAKRAAKAGDISVRSAIGWWVFHRWLARQPDCYQPDHISNLLVSPDVTATGDVDVLVREVFAPNRMLEMLRVLRMDAAFLTRSDRESALNSVRQVAGGTENEQGIREQLLGYLLTAAYLFTIDPTGLPETVVDHLGISYAVTIPDVHTTIRETKWVAQGRTRILEARCTHPAVDLALHEHAEHIDALLTEIDTAAWDSGPLAPLTDMPTHATADRVQPVNLADGSRAYDSSGFRFRLADDRIQELLMGAQLYGDPALATRELYQNALDACRYRQARGEYLRAKGTRLTPWSGEIFFTQGIDEHGRPYLDCTDNGIGMGLRELVNVFSYAGVRFTDLPEFIEEQAQWKESGITLYPNSRFGIGVLSYFMLADDITVTTCRFDRKGRPLNVLEAHIAGPGALFRVRDLGPGEHSFTTIRLHLRDTNKQSSYIDLLRRMLWISEYQVTATDERGRQIWRANELSDIAPIGSPNPLAIDAQREVKQVDATSTPEVWWCDSSGGILADGLWAGEPLFGAVVNLTGPCMPRLTVDRMQMLAYDRGEVDHLLRQATATLIREETSVLNANWLFAMVGHDPVLADAIFEEAAAAHRQPWITGGLEADIAIVGCFPDKNLMYSQEASGRLSYRQNYHREEEWPECISTWRAQAWSRAGLIHGISVASLSEIPLARPSDHLLIDNEDKWLRDGEIVPSTHLIVAAVRTRRSPADVAARLEALGFSTTDPANLPDKVDHNDVTIVSRDLDGRPPWLTTDQPVPPGHLIAAASRAGKSPTDVAALLKALGFSTTDPANLPDKVDHNDLTIVSRNLDGSPPWLTADRPVPPGHLIAAASRAGKSPADVAARLKALGFSTTDPANLPAGADRDDFTIVSMDLDGSPPWLTADRPVPPGHLIAAASRAGKSPTDVAARLKALGFSTTDPANLPAGADRDDLTIVSKNLDGRPPRLTTDQPVPPGHLIAAASRAGKSPTDVAARLKALGFSTTDPANLPDKVDHNDLTIVSRNLDGRPPWLTSSRPVPPGHLIAAAIHAGKSPTDVAARLKALGFSTTDPANLPAGADRDDLTIVSMDLDGSPPWLTADRPVPPWHLIAASIQTSRSPADIAMRLVKLGFNLGPLVRITERPKS
ncbi:wHTH domain-containing protein [Nonomuraea sp. NPDC002799]